MRTLALVVLLGAVMAFPLVSNAQQQQQDPTAGWQLHDPNEYRQEDSHPVRAIASLLSPIGFALEWGVARPWHYVATNTFLAPVLNGGQDDDTWSEYYGTPGPMTEVPIPQQPMAEQPSTGATAMREQTLAAPPAPAQPPVSSSTTTTTTATTSRTALGAPPYPQNSQGQSVIH